MNASVRIEERGYAHPEALVSAEWVANHLEDPNVRIVECNEDLGLYPSGHIPGAAEINWTRDLTDPLMREYLTREEFAALMKRLGVTNEMTVVLYGDKHNWWACYAFWVIHLFGHQDLRIMDGGRDYWIAEGRPVSTGIPSIEPQVYHGHIRNDRTDRAFRDQVVEHVHRHLKLIDVRSAPEFSGEMACPDEYPMEGALRTGHIPGARNVPWDRAVKPDGTFKTADELRAIYQGEADIREGEDVIVYCRIGERSSHTWFVLKYLLGYRHVRNYDGSWTEWGNLVGVPVAR